MYKKKIKKEKKKTFPDVSLSKQQQRQQQNQKKFYYQMCLGNAVLNKFRFFFLTAEFIGVFNILLYMSNLQ